MRMDDHEATDPEMPVWTFHRPDRTVGFWCRRMAQETTVHRVDAESAHADPVERSGDPAPLARVRELAAAATR